MTYRVCDDVRSLASTSQRISLKLEDGRRDTPIRSLWERALFRPPGVGQSVSAIASLGGKCNESDPWNQLENTSERAVLRPCCLGRMGAFVHGLGRECSWLRRSLQSGSWSRTCTRNSFRHPSRGRRMERACHHRRFVACEFHRNFVELNLKRIRQ
jgi:hypothetical protein